MVVTAVGGWLLLPSVAIDLPGLPPYGKPLAISLGILFGTIVFDSSRFRSYRPRWYDLPILVWCLCPFATSISNDLGPYDGISECSRQAIAWLFPYLIGRIYLTNLESFRELAMGMIIGGVCLIPLCLLEIRIGNMLAGLVYGFQSHWEGARDWGGYRPRVFFGTGLELGLWMNAVTMTSWWLWRSKAFRQLWGIPVDSVILPALMITSVLCKTTGATILTLVASCILWYCKRARTKWALAALLSLAPIYCATRINNIWRGDTVVAFVETYLSKQRAVSLEWRFMEEDVLVAHALNRPFFGWGGYNRSRPIDEFGHLSTADSLWTIVLGVNGYLGLTSMSIAMVLPVILFLRRFPVERWDHAGLAPVTALTVMLALFLLDSLANAMFNALYVIIAGGLVNIVPKHIKTFALDFANRAGSPSPRDRMEEVSQYGNWGRALKDQGRAAEAKAAWQHALELSTELMAADPKDPALGRQWCDCANDLAWLLAGAADPAVRDPAGAVALAVGTVERNPECSTYWNTLGAAYYRASDFEAAVAALAHAAALSDGGTAFDHLFLAMAHAQSGNPENARQWYDRAMIAMNRYPAGHAELHRLLDEAEALLTHVAPISQG